MSVYCPESDTTYGTFAAFITGESGSTFKTAVLSGTENTGDLNFLDADFTAGLTVKAASGEEWNPADKDAACAQLTGAFAVFRRDGRNVNFRFENIRFSIVSGTSKTYGLDFVESKDTGGSLLFTGCHVRDNGKTNDLVRGDHGIFEYGCLDGNGSVDGGKDGFYSGANNLNMIIRYSVIIDIPFRGMFRNVIHDCIVYDCGTALSNPQAGSGYNAIDDTSGAGTNYQNRTSADFENYAAGDIRTSSASAMATGGSTGGVVGIMLANAAPVSTRTVRVWTNLI